MTYKEAADHIRRHNIAHARSERNAVYITEALNIAVAVLESYPERETTKWEAVEDCDGDEHYKCAACGEEWFLIEGTPADNGMKYCPHCGRRAAPERKQPEWDEMPHFFSGAE